MVMVTKSRWKKKNRRTVIVSTLPLTLWGQGLRFLVRVSCLRSNGHLFNCQRNESSALFKIKCTGKLHTPTKKEQGKWKRNLHCLWMVWSLILPFLSAEFAMKKKGKKGLLRAWRLPVVVLGLSRWEREKWKRTSSGCLLFCHSLMFYDCLCSLSHVSLLTESVYRGGVTRKEIRLVRSVFRLVFKSRKWDLGFALIWILLVCFWFLWDESWVMAFLLVLLFWMWFDCFIVVRSGVIWIWVLYIYRDMIQSLNLFFMGLFVVFLEDNSWVIWVISVVL